MEKKFNLFVIIFLLIQPFLDIYAGSNLGSIHIFIRGIFLISIILYSIIKRKDKNLCLLTTILFIYFISYLFIYKYNVLNSISLTFKLFYLPLTTLFFYNYKEHIDNKYLSITLFSYIILFLLCYIFNLSHPVYEKGVEKEGFIGLFNSINEFSAILITLLPLVLYNLSRKKKYILCIILSILISIISMLTGTKVMLLGCIITFLYFLYTPFSYFFKMKDKPGKIKTVIILILIMGGTCFLITQTRAYKNAVIQAEFFKVKNIFSLKGINKVIFNDRFSFVEKNHKNYVKAPYYQKILGLKNYEKNKSVEIDLFDVFYQYGLIGLIVIISIILYYGYKSRLKGIYLLSTLLFLLISETSGHVLIYPAVSIYLGIIIYYNKEHLKN